MDHLVHIEYVWPECVLAGRPSITVHVYTLIMHLRPVRDALHPAASVNAHTPRMTDGTQPVEVTRRIECARVNTPHTRTHSA